MNEIDLSCKMGDRISIKRSLLKRTVCEIVWEISDCHYVLANQHVNAFDLLRSSGGADFRALYHTTRQDKQFPFRIVVLFLNSTHYAFYYTYNKYVNSECEYDRVGG